MSEPDLQKFMLVSNNSKRLRKRLDRAEMLLYRASLIIKESGETPTLLMDILDFMNERPAYTSRKSDGHTNRLRTLERALSQETGL